MNSAASCRFCDLGRNLISTLGRKARQGQGLGQWSERRGKSANSKGQVSREVEGGPPRGKAARPGWTDLPIRNTFCAKYRRLGRFWLVTEDKSNLPTCTCNQSELVVCVVVEGDGTVVVWYRGLMDPFHNKASIPALGPVALPVPFFQVLASLLPSASRLASRHDQDGCWYLGRAHRRPSAASLRRGRQN